MKFCLSSWSVLRAWFQDYWEYSLYSLPVRKCMYQHMSPLLFNCSVVSSSLQPHELQHTRLFYPSPSPGACWNSCPLSWWCHPTISSSVLPFPFCLQSFPASGSFLMSWLFTSGGQSIGAFSFSISPSSEYSGLIFFGIDWLDLLAVQGTLKSLLQHHSLKASILWCSAFFMVKLSHPYITTGKTIWLDRP